jgi:hypothetical protein
MKRVHDNPKSAATAIRGELKVKFPGIKFSVRSSRSGGSSIDIGWTDGPTVEQVAAITGKYSLGHFDGMTDCYSFDPTHVVAEDGEIMELGGAQYIFNNRRLSDAARAACIAACESYWADWSNLAEYQRDERMYRILYKSDLRGVTVGRLQYAENAGESVMVAA